MIQVTLCRESVNLCYSCLLYYILFLCAVIFQAELNIIYKLVQMCVYNCAE